jgi:gluconate kinase
VPVSHGSLLVLTGPPGAGKSTVGELFVGRRSPSALVDGDAFFGFLRAGRIDPWLPESHAQNVSVTAASGAATGCLVAGGLHVVFVGIVGPWFLDEFCAALGRDDVAYAVLLPPVEVCVHRVATRTGHRFHDEAATRQMHAQFAGAGIDERHLLTSPTASPAQLVDTLLDAQASGSLEL